MNNEIKEILDRFSFVKKEPDKLSYYPEDLLNREDMWLLFDYITNLQEENKELNDDNIWWNNRFKAVQRNYKDYKSRIDKAIEHLKEVMKEEEEYEEDYIYNNYLLDILQGVDKE